MIFLRGISLIYWGGIKHVCNLQGEKAYAEREIKQLHGQKTLLERDISKRDSLAGRRRDSVIDRSARVFDPKRAKSHAVPFEQTMQVMTMGIGFMILVGLRVG